MEEESRGRVERKWAQWSRARTGRSVDLDIASNRNSGLICRYNIGWRRFK